MSLLRNLSIKGFLHSFGLSDPATAVAKTRRLSDDAPVILLDIDGVINMRESFCGSTDINEGKKIWSDAVASQVKFTERNSAKVTDTLPIVYSPTVVRKHNEWSKVAEIQWLTSWGERANRLLAPAIGLDGPFATLPHDVSIPSCKRKFHCATDFAATLNPNRLIIWLEDDLMRLQKQVTSLVSLSPNDKGYPEVEPGCFNFRPNTLYVAPNYGLTPAHVELVDKYLADPALAKGKMIYDFDKKNEEPTILVDNDLVRTTNIEE